MALSAKSLCTILNPEVVCQIQRINLHSRISYCQKSWSCFNMVIPAQENYRSGRSKFRGAFQAACPVLESHNDLISSSDDFTIAVRTSENGEIKMRVNISGAKTQAIFDDVFSKLVTAAQPIPGFRRAKGGKTPDIPKHILLHIIGPSKVNKQAIKKIINTTVAEYVAKEGLKVTKDLKVEQTFEEIEAAFQPGKDFSFDAILQLQDQKTPNH